MSPTYAVAAPRALEADPLGYPVQVEGAASGDRSSPRGPDPYTPRL